MALFRQRKESCNKEMITIIDYGAGNIFSVEKAFAALGATVQISHDADAVHASEKIVLPGVGAFGDCMKSLISTGLIPIIKEKVSNGAPLLGICIGLQMLFQGSEESPKIGGLGILNGYVKKIHAPDKKIPHTGWNSLLIDSRHRSVGLLKNLSGSPYVYFVHSYHARPNDPDIISSTCFYGEHITSSLSQGNIMATQFHPEKSGDVGLQILKNFIEY